MDGKPKPDFSALRHHRAKSQDKAQRAFTVAPGRPEPASREPPVHLLEGTITPNGLHFERHHNGVPDIDPNRHELVIHGMVNRPLAFSVEALMRYPMETHVRFIECPGNSGGYVGPQPAQATAAAINGLISCSEWTRRKPVHFPSEARVTPGAKWSDRRGGADAAAMSRSVPLEKVSDDAVIAPVSER